MSGIRAHHQNAAAEHSICTVVRSTRTMPLHSAIYWPEVSDLMLWSFALEYAVSLWNCMPDIRTGLSPLNIFSAYALHPTLQDRKKLPKWTPREKIGQFLGWSQQHASSVALIQKLNTGSITPQFHTVMDDRFMTIARMGTNDNFTAP
eukprot:5027789-Ditylum_brightwellii.AAC.1